VSAGTAEAVKSTAPIGAALIAIMAMPECGIGSTSGDSR
jgi:hypothetical protein